MTRAAGGAGAVRGRVAGAHDERTHPENRMHFAERMSRITTAASFDTLARARALEAAGRDVVHLGIGEPDFDTPPAIRRAATEALEAGYTHYGPSAGLPELRRAVATTWRRDRGIPCDPEHVVITPGAKPILFFAMLALLEPGDEVLIPSPGFSTYASVAKFLDARVVPVPLEEARDFELDLGELERRITGRTRMLVLNSPHNPTGVVASRATIEALAALARRHDFMVLADEIYGRMVYEGEHVSIASLPGMFERTVVVDGFSKTYAMTGWRLGFGLMDRSLADRVTALMNNSNSCTATFVQRAGVAALEGPQDAVHAMLEEFRVRRNVVLEGLGTIAGIRCVRPSGAFYAYPNVRETGIPASVLADRLLEEAGVVTLAGSAFGELGDEHLRISYANSVPKLREGLHRIGEFLAVHATS